jgi:anti-sigma factor RsiW
MNCEELRESYELYALGVLDGAEYEALEDHLDRNCETCMNEIRRAVESNATVLRAIPKLEPPAQLRSRILAGFGIESKPVWLRALPWTVAAAAIILLSIVSISSNRNLSDEARVNARVVEFLNISGTTQYNFGGNVTAPRGRVVMSPRKGVLLMVGNLAPAPAGKMYETWIVPRVGAPMPVGQLLAAGGGSLVGLIPGPIDPASIGAVAVSIESAGSSPVVPAQVLFAAPVESR